MSVAQRDIGLKTKGYIQPIRTSHTLNEFVVQALAGAFAGLYDRITYGNTPLSHFGTDWWIGLIFVVIAGSISVSVRYYMGETLKQAIALTLILLSLYSITSIVFNSLWRYGVFIYIPYLTDPQQFFGSDVLVGMLVAMGAVMFLSLLPSRADRFTFVDANNNGKTDITEKVQCIDKCVSECPNMCQLYK